MDSGFPPVKVNAQAGQSNKSITNVIFLIQATAVFTAFPFLIAVIINFD